MNNDENETVRQTLERVMRERGYLKPENQTILQTPIGDFSYQISEQTPPSTGEAGQYFIKDDKNYAWDAPQKYDHRGNIASTINNFRIINQEHPIEAPNIMGSSLGDKALKMFLTKSKLSPLSQMKTAFDLGYLGAGYYDNFKRAYDESHRHDNMLNLGANSEEENI